jgi:hypothetical protein
VFGDIAKRCGAAIDLVHHTRKPPAGFVAVAGDINTARGAGALAGAVRAARTITPMSDKECEMFGLEPQRRLWHVRVDDAKGNMSAPAADAVWYERHSVELSQGDWVGVLAPWTPPDAFDGLSVEAARRVLLMIDEGLPDGQRYTAHFRAGSDRWAGNALTAEGISEAASKVILRTWLLNGVIYSEEYMSPILRKKQMGLFVDFSKIPG